LKSVAVWRRLPLALIILVLGLALAAGLAWLKPKPEPRPETEPKQPVMPVVLAQPERLRLSVETQATVEPRRRINLTTQVAGEVVEVASEFVAGGRFERGDLLLRLDPRDYRHAVTSAESNLKEAERALAVERGQARQAEREWRDLGNAEANALFLRKPQLAAAELAVERGQARQAEREWRDLGNAEANALFLRKPQLAAAELSVEAARAQLAQARLDLERTAVRAPFDGRVEETLVDLGQYLAPSTQVARVFDASIARLRLPLTESQAALLDLPLASGGQDNRPKVTISASVMGEQHQWEGRIERTEASLDTQTRMYYAVAEVLEPFNLERHPAPLLMGLFVSVHIEGKPLEDVVALPSSALFQSNLLYSLDGEQRVRRKQVRVLKVEGERTWVQGELSAGERIIVDRQGYVSPGVRVRLADAQAPDEGPEPEAPGGGR